MNACVVAPFLPFWKRVVALQSGNGNCFIAFWSRDPLAMTASLAVLLVLISAFTCIIFVYTTIAWKYSEYQTKKELKRRQLRNQVDQLRGRKLSENERRLITKAIVISATFLITWLPIVLKIIYEMSTNTKSSRFFQYAVDFFITINPILNAILLFQLDAKVRQNLLEILPFLRYFTGLGRAKEKKETAKQVATPVKTLAIAPPEKNGDLIPLQSYDDTQKLSLNADLDTVKMSR